jgi:hypothetical protein
VSSISDDPLSGLPIFAFGSGPKEEDVTLRARVECPIDEITEAA